jgi:small subunit ribosomal protein S3
MGQKVNPHGLRVGVIKDWDSKWYAEKDFADYLVEDHKSEHF